MNRYLKKAISVFDDNGYLSETDFIKKMKMPFIIKHFPNAKMHNGRINDPERIIQTPRRIATRMPYWIRDYAINGEVNIGGKLGTAMAAAWEADKAMWKELGDATPESSLRAHYPDSAFLGLLKVDQVCPSIRCNTIRSVKEIREVLNAGLPPAIDGVLRWVIKAPGHPTLADCVRLV